VSVQSQISNLCDPDPPTLLTDGRTDRQRTARKPCCGRETARCRCKIRYVSKFTAASRGHPCDSTASCFRCDLWL